MSMMEVDSPSDVVPSFLDWFARRGGSCSNDIEILSFPHMGRGVRALVDIPEDYLLFSIPRELVLQVKNSELRSKIEAVGGWGDDGEGSDWGRLILTMVWEWGEKGENGKWKEYFDIMPDAFDTLMFWSDEELAMLKGSMVVDKIGKSSSSTLFKNVLLPIVQKHPTIFTKPDLYTEANFHRMGSLILSRSFHVQEKEYTEETEENESEKSEEEDEEDHERVEDIGMVPFADILNAKTGCNNARLFYTTTHLEMRSTCPIAAGEQIFNTYSAPPNSDLLRRYGHVDHSFSNDFPSLSLDVEGLSKLVPNENDVVEISADLVPISTTDQKEREERIEWCLDVIGEDSFILEWDVEEEEKKKNLGIPDELWATVWLFALPKMQWEKVKRGDLEIPKTKKLKEDKSVLEKVKSVLESRVKEYTNSLEDDYSVLRSHFNGTVILADQRKLNAILVLFGEKLLLRHRLSVIEDQLIGFESKKSNSKTKGAPLESGQKKRRKV